MDKLAGEGDVDGDGGVGEVLLKILRYQKGKSHLPEFHYKCNAVVLFFFIQD